MPLEASRRDLRLEYCIQCSAFDLFIYLYHLHLDLLLKLTRKRIDIFTQILIKITHFRDLFWLLVHFKLIFNICFSEDRNLRELLFELCVLSHPTTQTVRLVSLYSITGGHNYYWAHQSYAIKPSVATSHSRALHTFRVWTKMNILTHRHTQK